MVSGNPEGVAFRATFPKDQFTPTPGGPVQGVVLAQTKQGGTGVAFSVRMENLPSEGGPFSQSSQQAPLLGGRNKSAGGVADGPSSVVYHIHQQPVPDGGNCTATGAHLDPYQRGETPSCEPAMPQTCQVGDLAGKHGAIVTTKDDTTFASTYTDEFTAVREMENTFTLFLVILGSFWASFSSCLWLKLQQACPLPSYARRSPRCGCRSKTQELTYDSR